MDEFEWYYKYVNAAYTSGYLDKDQEEFKPLEDLDFLTLNKIIDYFKVNKDMLSFNISEKKDSSKVSIEEWREIYNNILENNNQNNKISYKDLVVIGTPANMSNLVPWQMVTDSGNYYFEGLAMDGNLDFVIKALVRDNEIIYVDSIVSQNPTIKNVWVIENKDKEIKVFINGYYRSYYAKNQLSEDIGNVVSDLTLSDKKVEKINIKPNIINGKVLATTSSYIEVEKYGKVNISDNFKIYKLYNELEMEKTSSILVGYSNVDFVVENDKICAALIKEPIKAKNIRVLIKTKDYKSSYHEKVTLTSDKPFNIFYNGKKKSYKANEEVTLKPDSGILKEGRIRIVSSSDSGKIQIQNLERTCGNPKYRGTIELTSSDEGILIVNELSIEEYLYAVIPSEMPTSFGLDALKVQAICARSYAYNQLSANLYSSYGANVDDSTNSQVYNNVEENESSILAVKDTYGNVLAYNDETITAYYFSTSCGYTSDASDVWLNMENTPDYLLGGLQEEGADKVDSENMQLSNEESFEKFITNNDRNSYEKDYSWYRWKTTISLENLKKSIDKVLESRYNADEELILTYDEEKNSYSSIPIKTIGDVESFWVSKRGISGIVKEMVIQGSKATIKVKSEYNIRLLFAPLYDEIIRQDNSVSSNFQILPSAYFITRRDKETKSVTIIGGGYGHGVGMSQNGVKAMLDLGKSYEEVLKHYYPGVEFKFIY